MTGAEQILDTRDSRPDLPPLRIHHLLVWTAVTAQWLSGRRGVGIAGVTIWQVIYTLPSILGAAMAVTCCAFGIWWRHRRLAFPEAPGNWMWSRSASVRLLPC